MVMDSFLLDNIYRARWQKVLDQTRSGYSSKLKYSFRLFVPPIALSNRVILITKQRVVDTSILVETIRASLLGHDRIAFV